MTRAVWNPRCDSWLEATEMGNPSDVKYGCDLTEDHAGEHVHRIDENRSLSWRGETNAGHAETWFTPSLPPSDPS